MATLKERLALAAVMLEEAKKILAQREREYDDLFREATQGRKRREGTALQLGPESQAVEEKITAVLRATPSAKPYRDIAKEAGIDAETARTILYRMKASDKVEKPGRGLWKLKATQASA